MPRKPTVTRREVAAPAEPSPLPTTTPPGNPDRRRRYTVDDPQYLDQVEVERFFHAIDLDDRRAAARPTYPHGREIVDAARRGRVQRNRALFRCIYHFGLRASEPGLLTVADYDRSRNRIFTRRGKNSLSNWYPVPTSVARELNKYLDGRSDGAPLDPSALLFPSQKGGAISRQQVWTLFQVYATSAGIPEPKRHPHSLKHAIAAHMIDADYTTDDVRDRLGHRSATSTLIYAKVTEKKRRRVADSMDESPHIVNL